MRRLVGIAYVALALVFVAPLRGQARTDLIDSARGQFNDSVALELLSSAADPTTLPTDSLWAVSVHEIALRLMGGQQPALVSTWLRWSARHGTQWPIDPSFFPPALVEAYQQAASEAGATDDPVDGVATSWRWPNAFSMSAPGTIEAVSSDPTVQFSVAVAGRESFQGGSSLNLQPGSYELVASAEGFEPLRLTREVLPRVGTVLEFDLKPLLAAGVEASGSTNLVLIRAGLGGSAICTNGLIARPGRLVLTTLSALPATQGLEVVANSGQVYAGLSVAASDQARDLAVLRLEGSVKSPQPSAPSASNRPYAWSVYHPQCGAVTSTRTRLAAGIAASLAPTLPADARGAPLVDRNGALIGIVMGPGAVRAARAGRRDPRSGGGPGRRHRRATAGSGESGWIPHRMGGCGGGVGRPGGVPADRRGRGWRGYGSRGNGYDRDHDTG